MDVVEIVDPDTGSTAKILASLGFNCFEYRAHENGRQVDVLDSVPEFAGGKQRPSGSGIPILFPFPNRIRQGKFSWEGRDYAIPGTDKFGNAIHGFCLNRPWRVVRQQPNLVTGQFQLSRDAADRIDQWPADFTIEVDYEFVRGRLRANIRIFNPSDQSLPWGLGTHPYFKLPLGEGSGIDRCVVDVPAAGLWELVDCVPTGRIVNPPEGKDLRDGAYIDLLALDDVYTALDVAGPQVECSISDEAAGLQTTLACPPVFREIVMYTPPQRAAICIEPYTCPTDAVNLQARGIDAGWRTLAPGGEFHTWIDIAVSPILC